MSRHTGALSAWLALVLASALQPDDGRAAELRFALVIGNDQYKTAPPATPANDAGLVAVALGAEPAPPCHGPMQPRAVADLLFGRAIDHRVGVSEAAWARFVAREITPRFPDGLTIIDAVGQWRDGATGMIVREPAKQVEIVLPGRDDDEARLAAIAAAYKRAFRQHSVGVIVRSACVSF